MSASGIGQLRHASFGGPCRYLTVSTGGPSLAWQSNDLLATIATDANPGAAVPIPFTTYYTGFRSGGAKGSQRCRIVRVTFDVRAHQVLTEAGTSGLSQVSLNITWTKLCALVYAVKNLDRGPQMAANLTYTGGPSASNAQFLGAFVLGEHVVDIEVPADTEGLAVVVYEDVAFLPSSSLDWNDYSQRPTAFAAVGISYALDAG